MSYKLVNFNNRYSFCIVDKNKEVFDSTMQAFLIPGFQMDYQYAWEACSDLRKLVKSRHLNAFKKQAQEDPSGMGRQDFSDPIVTNISAEQMITDHYMTYLLQLQDTMGGVKTKDDQEDTEKEIEMVLKELEAVYKQTEDEDDKISIKKIVSEYKKAIRDAGFGEVIDELRKEKKKASIDKVTEDETMEDYAHKICQAIQRHHPSAIYSIDKDIIALFDKQPDEDSKKTNYEPIIKIRVNKNMNPDSIYPCGTLCKIIPYHSSEFFQKYWKPIVEAIGHFFINDLSALIISSNLPDMMENSTIEAWDINDNSKKSIELNFSGKKASWFFKIATVKTAQVQPNNPEENYFNKIVKCVDSSLESVNQRTGSVIQIIPLTDHVELDVNFGRGLGIVRLSTEQVEVVM